VQCFEAGIDAPFLLLIKAEQAEQSHQLAVVVGANLTN
jgi:hypothetical protein